MKWRRIGQAAALATLSTLIFVTPASSQLLGGGHRDETTLQSFRDCSICPEMMVVPAGSFMMGAIETDEDAYDNELPRHSVTIGQPFAIGITEVTFAQWDACVANNGCTHRPDDRGWGRGDQPAMEISWNDAEEYVVWLSGYTGMPYRLPSEAEWEYAARAGSQGRFSWGDDSTAGCDYANIADRTAHATYPDWDTVDCDDGYLENAPVASFRANAFGLYDTLGNVWEWVEDCWNPSYAGAPSDGSAWLTGSCDEHVLRGGAATGLPREVRLSQRGVNDPDVRAVYNGFRVVVPLDGH